MTNQPVTPSNLIAPIENAFFPQDSSKEQKSVREELLTIEALLQAMRELLISGKKGVPTKGALTAFEQKLAAFEGTLNRLGGLVKDSNASALKKADALVAALKEFRAALAEGLKAAPAAQENDDPANPFGTINSGNVALVTEILNKLQEYYIQIMNQFTQNTVSQVTMQGTAAQGAATAAFNSCMDDAKSLYCQMGMSFAGAAVAGLQAAGTHFFTRGLRASLTEADGRLSHLNAFEEPIRTAKMPEAGVVNNGEHVQDVVARENLEIVNTKKDLLAGNYKNFQSKEEVTQGLESLDRDSLKQARKEYGGQVKNVTNEYNAYSSQLQSTSIQAQTFGSVATSSANAGGQIGQAEYTKDKAQQEKDKTLRSTEQQMLQSGTGTTQQKTTAEEEASRAAIQMLDQISRSGQFQG